MKRILSIIGLLALTLALGSCYKDKGDYSYHPINDITFNIADTFRVNKFDSLQITPVINQAKGTDESHLKYEWSVFLSYTDITEPSHSNIVVLSTQRNLNIQVAVNAEPSPYDLSLKVTDTLTGVSYYKRITLYVSSVMQNGWMLLENKTDHSDISFISSKELIYHNVFSAANPGKTLSATANSMTSVNIVNGGIGALNFVLDDKDGWLMDKNSLQTLKPYSQCFYGTITSNNPGGLYFESGVGQLYTVTNGVPYSMNALYGAKLFGAAYQQPDAKGSYVAPFPCSGNAYGGIFFDQKNFRFLNDGFSAALNTFPQDNSMAFDLNNVHKQMLTLRSAESWYFQALFKNLNNDSTFLYKLDPDEDPVAMAVQPVLNSAGVEKSPGWVFHNTLKLMYWANGNKLYVYDITANQSRLMYTFPDGANVTAIQFRSGNIIAATYNGSAGGGSVYMFPLSTTGDAQDGTYSKLYTGFEKIVCITYKVG